MRPLSRRNASASRVDSWLYRRDLRASRSHSALYRRDRRDPARTDSSPAESYPSTGRTSGRSPRTDHGTAEMNSCTVETFIALDRIEGCTDGILRRTAQIDRRRARTDRCTGEIQASPARIYRRLGQIYSRPAEMYSRPAEMYSRPAEIYSRPAEIYSRPAGIVARPDRMDGNTARFALAHDRMLASTAHCSLRTAHWSGSTDRR